MDITLTPGARKSTVREIPSALGVLAVVLSAPLAAEDPPSRKDVLRRAGAYVQILASELPRLVVVETALQKSSPRPFSATRRRQSRRTVAEIAWVPISAQHWDVLAVRDVVQVDGKDVADRGRLEQLLHSAAPGSLSQVLALLDESTRYNLAPGSRNFNLPTVALFFLHPEMLDRFSWKGKSGKDGVWELEFEEKDRPTIVRTTEGEQAFSRGKVRVDATTGAVLRTELSLRLQRVSYWMDVTFGPVPKIGLTLPIRMEERYETPITTISGRAEYSDYRRFETGARLVR